MGETIMELGWTMTKYITFPILALVLIAYLVQKYS